MLARRVRVRNDRVLRARPKRKERTVIIWTWLRDPWVWVGLVMAVGGLVGACMCAWKMAPVIAGPCRCGGPPHATWCTEKPMLQGYHGALAGPCDPTLTPTKTEKAH